jgi:hypothetical protein
MPLGQCVNNHKYNKDKHGDICPICKVVGRKSKIDGKTKQEIEAMLKVPENKYVCAWLVCTEGINKGRSYEIHAGKNFIGGGDGMDIQILGDDKVDLYRHATIAYDTKKHKATLMPGESAGMVYLSGNAIYTPKELEDLSEIEIGGSLFKYTDFCGDNFKWGD